MTFSAVIVGIASENVPILQNSISTSIKNKENASNIIKNWNCPFQQNKKLWPNLLETKQWHNLQLLQVVPTWRRCQLKSGSIPLSCSRRGLKVDLVEEKEENEEKEEHEEKEDREAEWTDQCCFVGSRVINAL